MTSSGQYAPLGQTPWWDIENDAERSRQIIATVRDIEQRQSAIHEGNITHAREYAGYTPSALTWSAKQQTVRERTEATKNVVRSVCDTGTALISKTRPKPKPVTDGADWTMQQRAKDLDKFLVGAYAQSGLYQVAQRSFHDSTVFGTGAWKFIPKGGKNPRVDVERVLSDDLIVDEAECPVWPTPNNWYHRIRVNADVLARQYPEHATAIKAARGQSPAQWSSGRQVRPEEVILVEAYHLPIEEGGEGGRRDLVIDGHVIESEPWKHAWAPFVVLYWAPPITGFYGDGVAYRLLGRQMRINYMYRWIQRVLDLIVVPRVWVDSAGGPLKVQISNTIGEIVQTRGKVEFQTPQGVSAEYYAFLDSLERGGFEEEGISQLSASNKLPTGIESAPAQREYSYKEGQRFAPVSQRWEEAVAQESAYKMLALYKDLALSADEDSEPNVAWVDKHLFRRIKWKDVDMDTARYQIRVEASSLEALHPAGRTQAAIELAQTGWISPEEGRRLMGHPDLDRSYDLDTSARQAAEFVLEELLRGRQVDLDEFMDFQIQYEVITAGYRHAKINGAPKNVLRNVSDYLTALDVALTPPAPPPGMEMPMEGGMPTDPMAAAPVPGISVASAQGLNAPFSNGGTSNEGI